MSNPIVILGSAQSDFARNWARESISMSNGAGSVGTAALIDAGCEPGDIDSVHVANFVGEVLTGQGHLGALIVDAMGMRCRASRHEAACASGSMAILAAMAELQAGMAEIALVVGVEHMRSVSGLEAGAALGAAARVPDEVAGVQYPWPEMFAEVGEEYDRRYGLDHAHLGAIAEQNFANARANPLAHTRGWSFPEGSFSQNDEHNPVVAGMIRRTDCSQISDGAAAVVLATPAAATRIAQRSPAASSPGAMITGWGHRSSSHFDLREKMRASRSEALVFPHIQATVSDALTRAGIADIHGIDAVECHDCFTTTQYMIIDHLGLTAPGRSFEAIESGITAHGGALPINPSGGLIGTGHPVGATGVRMVRDAARQVTGSSEHLQVSGARRVATVNIGGAASTVASFVVERMAAR